MREIAARKNKEEEPVAESLYNDELVESENSEELVKVEQ